MTQDVIYFIAGGRTLAAIDAWSAARKAHTTYMRGLADEFHCRRLTSYGSARVSGFEIPADGLVPPGFRRDPRDRRTIFPRRNTQEGKALWARWSAAPPPMSVSDVMALAGMRRDVFHLGSGGFASIGWERVGEHVIVETGRLKDGSPLGGVPHDSERIPTSRYWALREACGMADP